MTKNNGEDLTTALKLSKKMVEAGKRPKATIPTDLPPGVFLSKAGEFVLPKQPAQKADILYQARQLRLDLQRRVERLSKLESEIQEFFINTLPKSEASGLAGKLARVQIEPKTIAVVEDYEKLYNYIRKTGAFELLQRRVNEGAVRERWENDEAVPGVGAMQIKKVSCTKL